MTDASCRFPMMSVRFIPLALVVAISILVATPAARASLSLPSSSLFSLPAVPAVSEEKRLTPLLPSTSPMDNGGALIHARRHRSASTEDVGLSTPTGLAHGASRPIAPGGLLLSDPARLRPGFRGSAGPRGPPC